MKTLNASDAKREFGELLLNAQKEPVKINKNGKPVAVVISIDDYEDMMTRKEQQLVADIQKGLDDMTLGKVKPAEDVFQQLHARINA